MPLYPLQFKPGIDKELPSLTSEPSWRDSNLVRFKAGFPEKMGGWQRMEVYPQLIGVPRSVHEWRLLNGKVVMAVGTSKKLYILTEVITDITPLRETRVLNNAFDTVAGSNVITVHDIAHGAGSGHFVTFTNATSTGFDDAEVNANHEISIIDDDTYTITVSTPATATLIGTGGTGVVAEYEIPKGADSAIEGFGWSAGAWGVEEWGVERSVQPETLTLRNWSLDNFGEDLVACHEGSPIYRWDATNPTDRAVVIPEAPDLNDVLVVTTPDRHLVTFASTSVAYDGGVAVQDKMLVRWASQEATNDWTPVAENTSGEQELSGGSKILAVHRAQGTTLIWTDYGLTEMFYQGPPYTFGFKEIAANCGALGRNCVVANDSVMAWMGDHDFFVYDGVVKPIPCTVHRHVFGNLNRAQADKVFAGLNKQFHEVIWFYPTTDSSENNRYVIFNYMDNVWYVGEMSRTAWIDSELQRYPKGFTATGIVYEHEYGYSADDAAMDAYIQSSEFDIDNGDKFVFIRRLLPDMKIPSGDVDYIFKTRRYPHSTHITDTTLPCAQDTEKLDTRIRTRQLVIRVESNGTNDAWRMGLNRIDIRPDGRR